VAIWRPGRVSFTNRRVSLPLVMAPLLNGPSFRSWFLMCQRVQELHIVIESRTMKLLPHSAGRKVTCVPRCVTSVRKQLVARAVAAPQLSPKEAGTEGAKNQLEALKQMSKIVADSGVRPVTQIEALRMRDAMMLIAMQLVTELSTETSDYTCHQSDYTLLALQEINQIKKYKPIDSTTNPRWLVFALTFLRWTTILQCRKYV
jgi:hypothetical protein